MPIERQPQAPKSRIAVLETSTVIDVNSTSIFPFDSARLLGAGFSYNSGDNILTVDETGRYEAHFVTGVDTSGQRLAPHFRLFKNRSTAGGGGRQLKSIGGHTYMRDRDGHQDASVSMTWVGRLKAGDFLSIETFQGANSGTSNNKPSETQLAAVRLQGGN